MRELRASASAQDTREIRVRSLFGTVRLSSPRWWSCPCHDDGPKTFSPLAQLLPARSTPELVFVETELAGLMSYRLATRVLERLLPIGRRLHPSEPRRHFHSVADASTTSSARNGRVSSTDRADQ